MSAFVVEGGKPVRLTSTDFASSSKCTLLGFYVASTSSGTIVFRDGGTSGTQVSGTITPAAGAFHAWPGTFFTSCHATIGGTLDVTFFVVAGAA